MKNLQNGISTRNQLDGLVKEMRNSGCIYQNSTYDDVFNYLSDKLEANKLKISAAKYKDNDLSGFFKPTSSRNSDSVG